MSAPTLTKLVHVLGINRINRSISLHLNHIKMKFWFNKPTQSVYYFSKVNGLVPFLFDFDKCRAFASIASVFYSIAFTLIISSYLTHFIYELSTSIIMYDDFLIVLILLVDINSALLKTFSLCVLQLVHRCEIIKSINLFVKICELLFEPECNHKLRIDSFFDRKLTNSCRSKCIAVGIQMLMLIIAFCLYDFNVSLYHTINNGILIFYTKITTTIVFSAFYCGGMLFSARLYQCLDKRLKGLSKSMDGSYNNEKHVDQISFLYERITAFTSKLCHIYAFQITISLIGIIVWVLGSVRNIEFLPFWSL